MRTFGVAWKVLVRVTPMSHFHNLVRALRCALFTTLATGCVGEAIDPGRSPNHPANPNTPEAPFSMPPNTLLPAETSKPVGPPASGVPSTEMPGMPGMEMPGMSPAGVPGVSGTKDAGSHKPAEPQ